MEARYQTDLYASYLLIPIEGKADEKKYSYKMLERNRIKGVLGCKKRIEDGKSYLYYDITRKKNLLQEYKDRELKFIEMTEKVLLKGNKPIKAWENKKEAHQQSKTKINM